MKVLTFLALVMEVPLNLSLLNQQGPVLFSLCGDGLLQLGALDFDTPVLLIERRALAMTVLPLQFPLATSLFGVVSAANVPVICIETLHDIEPGEELFLDYSLDAEAPEPSAFACCCGAAECRGSMLAAA